MKKKGGCTSCSKSKPSEEIDLEVRVDKLLKALALTGMEQELIVLQATSAVRRKRVVLKIYALGVIVVALVANVVVEHLRRLFNALRAQCGGVEFDERSFQLGRSQLCSTRIGVLKKKVSENDALHQARQIAQRCDH